MTIIRVMGATLADTCFSIDTPDEGEITWNVSKLQRAADAGTFGPPVIYGIDMLPPPNFSLGFLDRDKIDSIKRNSAALDQPVLAIEAQPTSGFALRCFCDGQHRLVARQELKLPTFRAFVVSAKAERVFRITVHQQEPT